MKEIFTRSVDHLGIRIYEEWNLAPDRDSDPKVTVMAEDEILTEKSVPRTEIPDEILEQYLTQLQDEYNFIETRMHVVERALDE